jgi:hypothetical protein
MRPIIIKYSIILLIGELISWWVLFYSPLNIPSHIPKTPINISGLLILSLVSIVIVFFQNESLNSNKKTTFIQLILMSGLVVFLAELVFQLIRFSTLIADTFSERLFYAIRGVIGITLMAIIISLITASIIKKRSKPVEQ